MCVAKLLHKTLPLAGLLGELAKERKEPREDTLKELGVALAFGHIRVLGHLALNEGECDVGIVDKGRSARPSWYKAICKRLHFGKIPLSSLLFSF